MDKRKLHQTQLAIIGLLHSKRELSPKQAARILDLSTPNVAYHFQRLRAIGVIELSRTQEIRGSAQHFYKLRNDPIEVS